MPVTDRFAANTVPALHHAGNKEHNTEWQPAEWRVRQCDVAVSM